MVRVIRFEIPVHMLLAWLTGRVKVTSTIRRSHLHIYFTKTSSVTPDFAGSFKNIFGETISFLYSLGYIHVLCVIRWGPTYSFPSLNFNNRAISEKFIVYLLYLALYPCKYHCNIYQTEDTLGINIYVKKGGYRNRFLLFFSFKKPLPTWAKRWLQLVVFLSSPSIRGFLRLSRVLPTSRVFTSGYVNTETILHFFNVNRWIASYNLEANL